MPTRQTLARAGLFIATIAAFMFLAALILTSTP